MKAINTMDDVSDFLNVVIGELGFGFHPDTDFADYVDDGKPMYADPVTLNCRMYDAFRICEWNGVDIYELSMAIRKDLGYVL